MILSAPSIPTEANIHQDMTKCRDAVKDKNWPLMRMLVQGVAAKAKRVAEVGRLAVEQAQEPGKKAAITAAVARLEHGQFMSSEHVLNHLLLFLYIMYELAY